MPSIFFGDLHNHNALGYGLGSLERSIDNARTHLDFFAFTGHSSWHDLQPMEGGREQHWLRGFEKLRQAWPQVQGQIAEANRDGEFCAFLGFEWHSSRFGDQCVLFADDHRPMITPDHIDDLRWFCIDQGALMIPHHLAYATGNRGVNWEVFDETCTPVVEIYSEHGNSEEDRGLYPYFTHSMGGRVTSNTARSALDRGLRFGFIASSDNHRGFPGGYGEGLAAVLATEFTREALFDALRKRRTYALTGDRIEVEFEVNGAAMGSSIQAAGQLEVAFRVEGRDELDVVEIVQDGEVVHRSYPAPGDEPRWRDGQPFQVRLEWGWGPWGDLALDRITDWGFEVEVAHGRLLRFFPCLQSGPFDEGRRHRFAQSASRLKISSYTSRKGAYRQNPNQSVVLLCEGGPQTVFDLRLNRPVRLRRQDRAVDLMESSQSVPLGPFPMESCLWHRLVPTAASTLGDRCLLPVPSGRSYLYLRVRQKNGQMAWTSPVFVNYPD